MSQAHALKDLTGLQFGRLTVIRRDGSSAYRASRWLCRCDCGAEKTVLSRSLRSGVTLSCGCLGKEHRRAASYRHGGASNVGRAEYHIWRSMKQRCLNPSDRAYRHYGGRGITVAPEWMQFPTFLADMGPKPFPTASLDRRNNDLGYSKANCYWATKQQQGRNKRTNVPVLRSDGKIFPTLVEASEATGVHSAGIRAACLGKQRHAGGYTWRFIAAIAKEQSNG